MIQLFVRSNEVDIDKSVGLYLTKTFESINNPTLYHSDFSKTITLPMTAKNRRVFEQYQRQDSVVTTQSIDPRLKIPYKLLYNSELVMDGYLKINNANTCFTDNRFEVELYGTFGYVMNEFAQLTFNKYECVSNGGSKDDKYLIESPWDNILVNASLVKQSFEQQSHNMNGNDILDYIKFIPTYQGQYPDFESDKAVIHPELSVLGEMNKERDEHYMREFRSYYQQPAIWVDKLWKMAKDKIDDITDYTLNLDPSWFNQHNPYWTKLLYTCPNLYSKDDNFVETSTIFQGDTLHYQLNIRKMSSLSNHHKSFLQFSPNNNVMYRNGIMNPDLKGPSVFKMNSSIMFLARKPWNNVETWARIRKVNPLFVTFNVINADTNEVYDSHRYMIYTNSWKNTFNSWYDEKINAGITSSQNPNVSGQYPMGFSRQAGWWWEAPIDIEFQVVDNIRYYIQIDVRFGCNAKAVAYSHYNNINLMAETWFYTSPIDSSNGYTIFNVLRNASCSTLDYSRSRSRIDMYRVFPKKDVTLLTVLLNYSKIFGLMWDIDKDNKTITVMTRNRFFTGHRILDWSNKIDRKHDFKLDPLCFEKRYVNFNIEEGKGDKYETYNNKYGVGYGSKKIDTGYQFNSDTEDLFKDIQPAIISQKTQFSILMNTDDPDGDNFIGYGVKVYPNERYLDNDKEGENAGNSGAFVFCNGTMDPDPQLGFKESQGVGYVIVTDDTEIMRKKDCYCWNQLWIYGMSSANGTVKCNKLPAISTISGSYSTDFERPAEYYFTGAPNNTRYVYDLYWKNFIDERYSVQNKKLTCYMYLTPAEYKGINFRDFVKIDNTLYHINKVIDYDFDANSPTCVELCQVWDSTAYTHGQDAWPALAVNPDELELTRAQWQTAGVYSTSEWYVDSKPTWVTYSIVEDDIKLRATSEPLHSRTGTVVLKNTQNLTATISVVQRPDNNYLILDRYTATVSGDGAVLNVNIDSRPSIVTVQSKPSWVDVEFIKHELPIFQLNIDNTVKNINTNVTKYTTQTAVITINRNIMMTSRTGTIVFTNGSINKSFTVAQLGRVIILEDFDCEPMHIGINKLAVWPLNTGKQIDPETVKISSLGTVTPPNKSIAYLPIQFQPILDPLDHGDGTPETICSGGMISILRKDGKEICKFYNYGDVANTYEILVEYREGGHFTVDTVPWYMDFHQTVDDGTVFDVEAVADTGWTFVGWSDGVSTASRTITVTGDIHIWPLFESGDRVYLYDDYKDVEYDNEKKVGY